MSDKPVITNEIQCPFFKALRDRSIVCESPVLTAASNITYFRTQSKKYSHILWHCNAPDGAGCPVHLAVMQKYAEKKGTQEGG